MDSGRRKLTSWLYTMDSETFPNQNSCTNSCEEPYLIPLSYIVFRTHWAKSTIEFDVAKRTLPSALVFASVSATFIGPGFSMGFIGQGYSVGLIYWLFGIVYGLQTIFVGIFIAPKLRQIPNAKTLAGVYAEKTNKFTQLIVGLLSVGLCAGFASVMLKAGGTLFESFFDWPLWGGVIFTAIITTIYTITGGLRASVATDAYQFVLFTILLPIILIIMFFYWNVNIDLALESANESSSQFYSANGIVGILGLVLAFFLGESMIPPYATRALASKSDNIAYRGFVFSGVFACFWFLVVILIGLFSRQIIDEGIDQDNVLLNLLQNFPPIFHYLVGIALVGIVMSSLDSLLNSGGVSFSEDVVSWFFSSMDDKYQLNLSRIGIFVISVTGCIAALRVESIIDGLLTCYAMWAPSIIPSLIYILFLRNVVNLAVILSILSGISVTLLMQFEIIDFSVEPIIIGMICSIAFLFLGHMGGRKWQS
ncbi:MAG: hypothetical protein GC179_30765 [Anaerolineaceae bacterium]|nr:hypothetical protein [Anaerolineaceae bacterium]